MFHAWFYLLSYVLSTLWSTFHMISWTNLLTRATVPVACFLLFLVSGKSENQYSRNWTGQKPKLIFYQKTRRRGATGRPHHEVARVSPGRATRWCGPPGCPPTLPLRL